MYTKYFFLFGLIFIILNFDFVNSKDKVSKLNCFLQNPYWLNLRNSLHIYDGNNGEITMDQLFDGFGTKDFVTSENLNDKARQFYLLLSCNLSHKVKFYIDYLKVLWAECKKYPYRKHNCKFFITIEFTAFTNFIADWPAAFSSFSNYTEMELKNNINSYVDIVYYLASSYKHSDKDLDEKFDELDNNVRDFMNNNCRPKQPNPSNLIEWYNTQVENLPIDEMILKVKFYIDQIKLDVMVIFLKFNFQHTKKSALKLNFCYQALDFEKFLNFSFWKEFSSGLHIYDGNNGETTMDQLFDGFGTKNFVTSQNKNDKVRHFYLLLSCNFSMKLEEYTDLVRILWGQCKKHTSEKIKCKKQLIMEFASFTNFIVDWPAAFSSFSNYTEMELKNNVNSYVDILHYLASSNNHSDKDLDEKLDELYNNVREFMNNNCRPKQPILSKVIEWYNAQVERERSIVEISADIKRAIYKIKISVMVIFLKFSFMYTIKNVPKMEILDSV